MIKKADSLKSVSDQLYDSYPNVFFDQNYLKFKTQGHDAHYMYLYSESLVIPIIIYKKYIFKYGVFQSEPYMYRETPDDYKTFLDEVIAYLKDTLRIDWINSTLASSLFHQHPTNSLCIPFGSNVVDLSNDEDVLFSNLHSKHRNVVRKAQRDEVFVKFGKKELLDDYTVIDKETWERSDRVEQGKDYYLGVLNALPDNSFISIAYLNGVPQCGSIIFYSKNMAYYMYGASANGAHNGAGCLLQWENMLYLKKLDVQKYSFVGYRFNVDDNSKLQNIQRFKERFGGEVDRGFMFKCIMRPRKRRLFEILCKIKGIKEYDAIDQEIHKWGDKPSVNSSEV